MLKAGYSQHIQIEWESAQWADQGAGGILLDGGEGICAVCHAGILVVHDASCGVLLGIKGRRV